MLDSSPRPFGNEVLAEFISSTILWRDNNHQTCLAPYSNYLTPWSFSFASIIQPTCKQRQLFHTASGGAPDWTKRQNFAFSASAKHHSPSFSSVTSPGLDCKGKKRKTSTELTGRLQLDEHCEKTNQFDVNSPSPQSAGQFRSSYSAPGYETSLCWIKNAMTQYKSVGTSTSIMLPVKFDKTKSRSSVHLRFNHLDFLPTIVAHYLTRRCEPSPMILFSAIAEQLPNYKSSTMCSSDNSTCFPASSFLSTGLELSLCWRSLLTTIGSLCVFTGNPLSVFVNFIQHVCYSPDLETGLWMTSIITFHVRQFCLTSLSSLQTFDKVSSGQTFRQSSESLSTFILPGHKKKSP